MVSRLTARFSDEVPARESKAALVGEYRRETIERAARRVIARRGLRAASMQAIAAEAGVAKGTLYLYFRDRDDLLEHASGRIFDDLLARAKAVLTEPRPLRERLVSLVRTEVEFFDAHRDFLRVLLAMQDAAGDARHRRKRRRYARYLELLAEQFGAAARRGEARAFPPERLALFFAEGKIAVLRQRLQEPGRAVEEDAEWIVNLLLDGLCPRRRS
jgi:AcrR family transcriptional regulator